METHEISLTTICDGGVPEVFAREFKEVLANILDPNTDPERARGLTLKFTIKPYEDRTGAQVSFTCKSTLQPVAVAKSTVFLSRHTGALKAYTVDQRQGALFGTEEKAPPVTAVK